MSITYAREQDLSPADYIAIVGDTTLAPSRPLGNVDRIAAMLAGANFVVVARDDGQPVGVARCISDDAWVCYCCDLAVRQSHQKRGIGRGLIDKCRDLLGPRMGFVLVSEPEAEPFYAAVGMSRHAAFFHTRADRS